MAVKLLSMENADVTILMTLAGIVTPVRPGLFRKVLAAMAVTD